jgi:glycosyltransferase involved in cell wall biosynthesis
VRILLLNCACDTQFTAPNELLNRYSTLTGWAEALRTEGASAVSVLQHFPSDAQIHRNGIEYFFRNLTGIWSRELRQLVLSLNAEVVHVNGLIFPWQTWSIRRVLRGPVVIVLQDHGGIGPARNPFVRFKQRFGLNLADAFLFSAVELADPWRRAGLINSRQSVIAVMESSTNMRPLPCDAARAISAVTGSPALLWVGRLNANKDPLTVLDGFERALACLPGARLTMVYSSEELLRPVQERIARSVLLTDSVHLRGYVPREELAAFYSAADFFVLGSHHEGSGYALIEAMACGATPIVTNIPSFRALTGNGAVGAIWPVGNTVAFAEALIHFRARDLGALRAPIRTHFERELSWPVIGQRALAAYAKVMAGNSGTVTTETRKHREGRH